MKLETKFKLGHTVYIIAKREYKTIKECPTCKGTGKKSNELGIYKCPNCLGSSFVYTWIMDEWKLNKEVGIIDKIKVELTLDGHECFYVLSINGVKGESILKEEDLFSTEKEAIEECKLRNKSI